MTPTSLLQIIILVVLLIIIFILKKSLPSYLSEKGKNMATKQDIGEITEIIEHTKAAINKNLETFKLSLNKELSQFTTQFSRLDQQRATGVMSIHAIMCDIEQLLIWQTGAATTARIAVSPEERTMEALNKSWELVVKLNHVLNYHSLLLNERVYQEVLNWSREVMTLAGIVGNEIEPLRKQSANSQRTLNEREAAIEAIRDKHLDKGLVRLGQIRKELEAEFRGILEGTSEHRFIGS
jgi:hypothetical protein